jgi:hypothetical protein
MSIRRVVVVAAVAAVAGAATSAFSLASGAGRTASTQRCFDFTVVQPDPMAQFSAGTYQRQNFSPGNSLSCNTTFNIFRSYLYDPQWQTGWTVGPLTGSLRGQIGKRFVAKGTNNSVGFNIYRAGRAPITKPLVKNVSLQPNTTRTYSVTVPTRIPDVRRDRAAGQRRWRADPAVRLPDQRRQHRLLRPGADAQPGRLQRPGALHDHPAILGVVRL